MLSWFSAEYRHCRNWRKKTPPERPVEREEARPPRTRLAADHARPVTLQEGGRDRAQRCGCAHNNPERPSEDSGALKTPPPPPSAGKGHDQKPEGAQPSQKAPFEWPAAQAGFNLKQHPGFQSCSRLVQMPANCVSCPACPGAQWADCVSKAKTFGPARNGLMLKIPTVAGDAASSASACAEGNQAGRVALCLLGALSGVASQSGLFGRNRALLLAE
ncbi:uncharacterized protein LOC128336138 [Hemicordylus capensis]|uniref:uncharacterized protein LOC128336138 n=1 Tax=Hemicordylus capensis TaxID=884348 RepID=UPI0023032311|nr:uncharacterized protein LOC128336138 [Hemicordylus capensis]